MDLISRQTAIELIHSLYPSAPIMRWNIERWEKKYKPYIEAEKVLEMLPSAEPEIIRCKDCKYYADHSDDGIRYCKHPKLDTDDSHAWVGLMMDADDYCSKAERRQDA